MKKPHKTLFLYTDDRSKLDINKNNNWKLRTETVEGLYGTYVSNQY